MDFFEAPYYEDIAGEESTDSSTSIIGALKYFENSVDMMRISVVSSGYSDQVNLI